jgi:hypothetical protein
LQRHVVDRCNLTVGFNLAWNFFTTSWQTMR